MFDDSLFTHSSLGANTSPLPPVKTSAGIAASTPYFPASLYLAFGVFTFSFCFA
jgi:hypothetical protein